jgi:hypothetical protein
MKKEAQINTDNSNEHQNLKQALARAMQEKPVQARYAQS